VEDGFDNPANTLSSIFTIKAEYTCSGETIVINDDSDNSVTNPDSLL
jgi:hypothetical protein